MPDRTPFNGEKLAELILYIVNRSEDASRLGATKLQKILWFSDLHYFHRHGRSITGSTYRRMNQGPWNSVVDQAIKRLETDHRLAERPSVHPKYKLRRFFALEEARVDDTFVASEISLVDEMVDVICNDFNANEISAVTHDHIWKYFDTGDEISLAAAMPATFIETDPDVVRELFTTIPDEVIADSEPRPREEIA